MNNYNLYMKMYKNMDIKIIYLHFLFTFCMHVHFLCTFSMYIITVQVIFVCRHNVVVSLYFKFPIRNWRFQVQPHYHILYTYEAMHL